MKIFTRSEKIGMTPGSYVFLGEKKQEEVLMNLMDYDKNQYEFRTIENIEEAFSCIDKESISWANIYGLHKIDILKRIMIMLRKHIRPFREVVHIMTRGETPYFQPATIPFLRDLYDHIIQVIDTAESYREMVGGIRDMHMAAMSNRMNEVMKILTIIATIFIPLSFFAGVFGMNFDTSVSPFNMPELHYRYGYPLFWLFSILIAAGLMFIFKHNKWL